MTQNTAALTQYHRDVYLPGALENRVLTYLVRLNGRYELTRHAAERAQEKGIALPTRIPVQKARVVEVTQLPCGEVYKFLIRFCSGDGCNDICMSLNPHGRVPTVWLNQKGDRHRTLNRSRYRRAEEVCAATP